MNLPPSLEKPVQFLKGVGPKRSECLAKLGVVTVWDLLNHFPREHDDRSEKVAIGRVHPGTVKTLRGKVEGFEVIPAGRQLALGKALIGDGTGYIWAVWFRRTSPQYDAFASLAKQLVKGAPILVHGAIERNMNEMQIRVDEHDILTDDAEKPLHVDRLVPLYPLTEGIEARWLRELIWDALAQHIADVRDPLPPPFLEAHRLAPLSWAIQRLHFPSGLAERDQARRRLAFEEFFFLELALGEARLHREEGPPAAPCRPTRALLTPFRRGLGFEFTEAQKRVINEIFDDMARDKPMSRLLQGDVGSGKTVVALSAALLAVENGRQAALMAPTEILAEQHFLTLNRFFAGLPVRYALFTGDVPPKQKAQQLEGLKSGEIHMAVGTHALIQESIEFKSLGLAVIDEQHRFGVRQRAELQKKAEAPHVLIMTATPIPRTLALTFYGDLAVSTIDELPPGRPAIGTHWTLEDNAFGAVRKAVEAGQQAYVVVPLVDESEKLDLRAAIKEFERLKTRVFPDFTVGLLHGRLKPHEKEETMMRFVAGEIQVLVATPVVEVGIDVANATVMVVMDAERFGLAQLHQLRGRVGRGKAASSCHVVAEPKSDEAAHRLRLICQNADGFKLAEEDLKVRGPGEFLGESQHGLPPFKVGNLVRDGEIIVEAREAAFGLLKDDPRLETPANAAFAAGLKDRFAGKLFFGQVA